MWYIYIYIYTHTHTHTHTHGGCDRNASHILNSHLCGATELRQVVMVAPST